MSGPCIRLTTPPTIVFRSPQCGTCGVDVDSDGDGWVCPVCGTFWPYTAGEDDPGTLYSDWSGEEVDGPLVTEKEAERWGDYYDAQQRHRLLPTVFPAPTRPATGVRA